MGHIRVPATALVAHRPRAGRRPARRLGAGRRGHPPARHQRPSGSSEPGRHRHVPRPGGHAVGGSITVEPVFDAGADTPEGFEAGVAGLVQRGDADLGLAASRAWDLAGVTSLQALQAPFLITDDALAAAVAASPIADDLLAGMTDAGVTGLALWPEDLRHPFSFVPGEPLVHPDDFVGDSILVQPSALSRQLVTTLGATVFPYDMDRVEAVAAGLLQGAESGLLQGQSLPGTPTATGDVVFYPKFQVLVANSAAFAKLTVHQQAVLREAALATRATTPSRTTPRKPMQRQRGATPVAASSSPAPRASRPSRPPRSRCSTPSRPTRSRRRPSTPSASSRPPSSRRRGRSPVALTGCGGAVGTLSTRTSPGSPGSSLPPDGSYRGLSTREQLLAGGASESYAAANAGIATWTFDGGTASLAMTTVDGPGSCTAAASIVDDRVRLVTTSPSRSGNCGITIDFVWRLDGDDLYMTVVGSSSPGFTEQDLRNEQAWKDIPSVRID